MTRLYHKALADQLIKDRPQPSADHAAVLRTLLPAKSAGWADASPYALSYAADHAAAAGQLTPLIHDPQYLAHADLARLSSGEDADEISVLLRFVHHRTPVLDPAVRLAILDLGAAHLGLHESRRLLTAKANGGLRLNWAQRLGVLHQVVVGDTSRVTAVAVGRLDSHYRIIAASGDGTVRIWDPDGQPIGEPLAGHTDEVTAAAVGRLDGHYRISAASGDGTVRIWDPDGRPIGEPLTGHTSLVTAVAVARLDAHDRIVSASRDGGRRRLAAEGHRAGERDTQWPLADPELENAALKDIAGTSSHPGTPAAGHCALVREMGVSERFACRVTLQNGTTLRRPPVVTTKADLDAADLP